MHERGRGATTNRLHNHIPADWFLDPLHVNPPAPVKGSNCLSGHVADHTLQADGQAVLVPGSSSSSSDGCVPAVKACCLQRRWKMQQAECAARQPGSQGATSPPLPLPGHTHTHSAPAAAQQKLPVCGCQPAGAVPGQPGFLQHSTALLGQVLGRAPAGAGSYNMLCNIYEHVCVTGR